MQYLSLFISLILLFISSVTGENKIASLENDLNPYFQSRIRKKTNTAKVQAVKQPSQEQLFQISWYWKELSNQFKKTYLQALEIPSESIVYSSPGYGVEIYYTINGINSVDPVDTWGCDTLNWRNRLSVPNGIPDYIDEVAWSIDSSWCMEIKRFGFKEPYPFVSENFNTSAYKVLVENMDGYYGLTYCAGQADDEAGSRSLLTIRNNWEGWDLNDIINYQSHPEKAIRITCAHEFFHAVQFSMIHSVNDNIYLDQYPVSWIEATAVMMEELAFDYVNDYTQYVDIFLQNPANFSFFSQSVNGDIYANSIAALFLYHCTKQPGINLVKDIFESNYERTASLDSLLMNVSKKNGTSWPELLSRFHTESFFTGDRQDRRYFIPDSKILGTFKYSRGECSTGVAISRSILPYGMQIFSFVRNNSKTSSVVVKCRIDDTDPPVHPLLKVILTGGVKDTIIAAENFTDGVTSVEAAWGDHNEAIAIVSNGNYDRNINIVTEYSDGDQTESGFPSNKLVNKNCGDRYKFTLNGSKVKIRSSVAPGIYRTESVVSDKKRVVLRRSKL